MFFYDIVLLYCCSSGDDLRLSHPAQHAWKATGSGADTVALWLGGHRNGDESFLWTKEVPFLFHSENWIKGIVFSTHLSKTGINFLNIWIYRYLPLHKFDCWTQDVSYFTVKSILSILDWLPNYHLWCHKSCSLSRPLKSACQWGQRNFSLTAIKVKTAFLVDIDPHSNAQILNRGKTLFLFTLMWTEISIIIIETSLAYWISCFQAVFRKVPFVSYIRLTQLKRSLRNSGRA